MELKGQQILGAEFAAAGTGTFRAVDPATGRSFGPAFHEAIPEEVAQAVRLAEAAFESYSATSCEVRASLLEAIAEQLEEISGKLIKQAHLETGLPVARLQGELGRTTGQFRLFAGQVREGAWQDIHIDLAQPDRAPQPRPDLRRRQVALGPVVVFGASNFPLAFSVPGGDTASALAAGCPVVVKGHPAHPGTSELAGRAIQAAVSACDLPPGTFSLLQGESQEVGAALVNHPLVKAVAFTGSLKGGRALFDLAAARPEPIPVFAEMGSINPVFLLPQALEERADQLASEFVASLTLGVGQFCTNPGLVVMIRSQASKVFSDLAANLLQQKLPEVMLHPGIKQGYQERLAEVQTVGGMTRRLAANPDKGPSCKVSPALYEVDAELWLANPSLAEEIFGPAAIIVVCYTSETLQRVARQLKGQLTATLHGTPDDLTRFADLIPILERKAGRLVCNGFPTGVEVCASMVHGGPYPATTESRSTSVGDAAMQRFLRPVCYQGFSPEFLPASIQSPSES